MGETVEIMVAFFGAWLTYRSVKRQNRNNIVASVMATRARAGR